MSVTVDRPKRTATGAGENKPDDVEERRPQDAVKEPPAPVAVPKEERFPRKGEMP